jgi:hypothetical protein
LILFLELWFAPRATFLLLNQRRRRLFSGRTKSPRVLSWGFLVKSQIRPSRVGISSAHVLLALHGTKHEQSQPRRTASHGWPCPAVTESNSSCVELRRARRARPAQIMNGEAGALRPTLGMTQQDHPSPNSSVREGMRPRLRHRHTSPLTCAAAAARSRSLPHAPGSGTRCDIRTDHRRAPRQRCAIRRRSRTRRCGGRRAGSRRTPRR